jgi:hypothetical protein
VVTLIGTDMAITAAMSEVAADERHRADQGGSAALQRHQELTPDRFAVLSLSCHRTHCGAWSVSALAR